MARINRDTVCAIVILMAGGVFFWATFSIPDMQYESLGSEVWPRIILLLLFLLTFGYLEATRWAFFSEYPDVRQMPFIIIDGQRVGGLAGLQAALKQVGL